MVFKRIAAPDRYFRGAQPSGSVRLRHYKGGQPAIIVPVAVLQKAAITLGSRVDLMVDSDRSPPALAIVCHGKDARVTKVPATTLTAQILSTRLKSIFPVMATTDVPHEIGIVDGRQAIIVPIPVALARSAGVEPDGEAPSTPSSVQG